MAEIVSRHFDVDTQEIPIGNHTFQKIITTTTTTTYEDGSETKDVSTETVTETRDPYFSATAHVGGDSSRGSNVEDNSKFGLTSEFRAEHRSSFGSEGTRGGNFGESSEFGGGNRGGNFGESTEFGGGSRGGNFGESTEFGQGSRGGNFGESSEFGGGTRGSNFGESSEFGSGGTRGGNS